MPVALDTCRLAGLEEGRGKRHRRDFIHLEKKTRTEDPRAHKSELQNISHRRRDLEVTEVKGHLERVQTVSVDDD